MKDMQVGYLKNSLSGFMTRITRKPIVLFVCTGNAGRSQMAEAMFRQRHNDVAGTLSAGVEPWGALHHMAVKLMAEQDIAMAEHYPKHVRLYMDTLLDVVVTIGDRARAETCAFQPGVLRIHWEIADPADADGTPESEAVFRKCRQDIADRFPELVRILKERSVNRKGMKPAICTGFDCDIPFAETIPMIRDAGFEIISIGARPLHSGYTTSSGLANIQKLLTKTGLTAESVHAPFPEGDRLFSLDESERRESIRQCRLAVDAAAELDGRIVVVHLIQPYTIPHGEERDRMIGQGRRSIGELAEYAAGKQVKIALENGQKADYDQVVADFLVEFNGESVGFCYDSGHENVQGTCFRMLERFGHRLLTLHIHDNRGTDIHILPYEGTIPWDRFPQIFDRLPYSGNLLLEVDIKHSQYKDPAVFLREARERAERILQPQ